MNKCPRCGSDIPESMLVCPDCGYEVQMVPDYNPLDDVLAREIDPSSRRRASEEAARRKAQAAQEAERARRRKAQQEKMRRKKRHRRNVLITLLLLLASAAILLFLIYRTSYSGLVKRGENALADERYGEAESLLNRAIDKQPEKGDAYRVLYKVYVAQDETDEAEEMLLDVVAGYPDKPELYEVLFKFYIDTDQSSKIAVALDSIEDESVLDKLKSYNAPEPKSSLEQGEYDDVQQVTLEAKGAKEIYYTTDGSDPDKDSKRYINPIQISEGETVVQAISVNKKGIESLPVSFKYTVEIPIADAPAVTPSTGQYTSSQQITVQVPEGYTAYYTTDGTEPSPASDQYTEPIEMPKGNTIFSVILLSPDGKLSDITKRNYERL